MCHVEVLSFARKIRAKLWNITYAAANNSTLVLCLQQRAPAKDSSEDKRADGISITVSINSKKTSFRFSRS
jgi:hypothetical protein